MLDQTIDRPTSAMSSTADGLVYRGVEIKMDAAGTSFSFTLPDYPLQGWAGLNCFEMATKLVDGWLDRPRGAGVTDSALAPMQAAFTVDSDEQLPATA